MPFDEEKHIKQLIEMYRQGFEEILRIIVEKEAKGQWTRYWRDLLLEVMAILQQLDEYADQWIEQTIGQVYSQAAAETAAFLMGLGIATAANPAFAQLHQRAIDVVAQNMADNLRDATQFIGRRVNDVFRQVGLEETGRKLAARQTWQDMKQKVVQQLLDKGQTAFVDRLGRRWRLDTYAELVARTTTREAASVATMNTCQEFGLDLVRITTHYPTCEKCASLQGKVYSISGKDKRYPKLTDDRRPPIHPNCYSKDTEIYTKRGWINITEARVGDLCLSLNPETLQLEWVPVVAVHKVYAEELIWFHNRKVDLCVTPDHRMFYQKDWDSKHNKDRWIWRTAEELEHLKSGYFLLGAKWDGWAPEKVKVGMDEIPIEEYAELMGWYLAEGSVSTGELKRVQIAQSRSKNPDNWEAIKQLLDRIGVRYSCNDERFVIYRGWYEHFSEFGKSHEKYVPEVIKNASPHVIRRFLDAFNKGDGSRRKGKPFKGGNFQDEITYFTSSDRLAGDLGELILKVGGTPSFYRERSEGKTVAFSNGNYTINHDLWRITERRRTRASLANMKVERIEYHDYAYDVELEKYHVVFVRRNGKPIWSGNCRHVLAPYVRELDDNAEETEHFSNQPLDKDPRSEAEKQAYEELIRRKSTQKQKQRIRYDQSLINVSGGE